MAKKHTEKLTPDEATEQATLEGKVRAQEREEAKHQVVTMKATSPEGAYMKVEGAAVQFPIGRTEVSPALLVVVTP